MFGQSWGGAAGFLTAQENTAHHRAAHRSPSVLRPAHKLSTERMRERTAVGFIPAQALRLTQQSDWNSELQCVCHTILWALYYVYIASLQETCSTTASFISRYFISQHLSPVTGEVIRPTNAHFVNFKLLCQSKDVHQRRWEEVIAPVLWCGMCVMPNLGE